MIGKMELTIQLQFVVILNFVFTFSKNVDSKRKLTHLLESILMN